VKQKIISFRYLDWLEVVRALSRFTSSICGYGDNCIKDYPYCHCRFTPQKWNDM